MSTEKTASGSRKTHHLRVFLITAAITFVFGTCAYIYSIPRAIYAGLNKEIVDKGFGSGSPIPVNTLYTVPYLPSPTAKSFLLRYSAGTHTLFSGGWLDLKRMALVLHVPDMSGRYYSIQFTDPKNGSDFAYVGRRTTGTEAGDYLITGPRWHGTVPSNMKRIASPDNSVLVTGRVFVKDHGDLAAAYDLSKQITLAPFVHGQ